MSNKLQAHGIPRGMRSSGPCASHKGKHSYFYVFVCLYQNYLYLILLTDVKIAEKLIILLGMVILAFHFHRT